MLIKKPDLVLLCDSYPLAAGEFFLDDELRVIHPYFNRIVVLIKKQAKSELHRFIPPNLEVKTYDEAIDFKAKLRALPIVFSRFFIDELFRAIFKFKVKDYFMLLKVMYRDIIRSSLIIKELEHLKSISDPCGNLIFYSYWHDYRALALARFSKREKEVKTVARAHRWDLYFYANSYPYLPYKTYIVRNLKRTFCISNDGAEYFKQLLTKDLDARIAVSKLGKINNRIPQFKKGEKEKIIICSCSHFNSVKRVDLIVDILANLNRANIYWVHFGWGPTELLVLEKIKMIVPDLNFKFFGLVSNEKVLDFYSENFIDLFISVSESEGVPVSIMEALSAGIPVIATDVGAVSEVVSDSVGFLLEKEFSPDVAANIIQEFFDLPEESQVNFRKNAYLFWQKNFNAEINYSKFVELIQNTKK